jgi:3-hydroxypropionate dehydrogenase (NADP+)
LENKKSPIEYSQGVIMIEGIEKISCIGSGLVGQGWAAQFAVNGYKVTLQDLTKEKVDEAYERVTNHIHTLVEAGLGKNSEKAIRSLNTSTELEDVLSSSDFVIESVFENLEVKQSLYKKMDELTSEEIILASSTSGLMMSDISKDMMYHPERAIVAHPWNPVHLVPLVELSPGKKTSEKTIEITFKLMKKIGKEPVVLKKEVPGFIANRISAALWRKALDLVDKGVASVENVDKAIRAGPGIRWAIMGPYLVYHLGGGKGGIEYLMRHIGVSKAKWLENMAKWTETPESAIQKAVEGVNEMVGEKKLEELEEWRDRYLISLNKLLWNGKEQLY